MAKPPKPWEEKGWVLGEQLEGGNQGHTFLAREADDPPDTFEYVLKRLKRQDDLRRRKRMYVEAQSLRVLDSTGISKLIDSNVDRFEDTDIPLYMVTERIPGPDLTSCREEFTDPINACKLIASLLDTLKACHSVPVVHRDIKPCHVIFRNGDPQSPVLIDFGLSFNGELQEADGLTADEEGVGNRFIILLEQLDGGNKKDPRSDITQCVGLLFYALTDIRPGLISPFAGTRPHDKIDFIKSFPQLTGNQARRLRNVFDIGFEGNVTKRWQTADQLQEELRKIMAPDLSPAAMMFDEALSEVVQELTTDPEFEARQLSSKLLGHFKAEALDRSQKVLDRCREQLQMNFQILKQDVHHMFLKWDTYRPLWEHKNPPAVVLTANRVGGAIELCGSIDNKPSVTVSSNRVRHSDPQGPLPLLLLEEVIPLSRPDAEIMIADFLSDFWLKAIRVLLQTKQTEIP